MTFCFKTRFLFRAGKKHKVFGIETGLVGVTPLNTHLFWGFLSPQKGHQKNFMMMKIIILMILIMMMMIHIKYYLLFRAGLVIGFLLVILLF